MQGDVGIGSEMLKPSELEKVQDEIEREDCVGVPRSALAECTAGDLVTTEQQRDRGRVLVFTVHSATHLALSPSQFHAHHDNNNKELTL